MNQSTLETLFRKRHARLLAEARAMLYVDAEAQDVVSELFAKLLKRAPRQLDDLIRQLPGVTMNDQGEIFVNGRKVDEDTFFAPDEYNILR